MTEARSEDPSKVSDDLNQDLARFPGGCARRSEKQRSSAKQGGLAERVSAEQSKQLLGYMQPHTLNPQLYPQLFGRLQGSD